MSFFKKLFGAANDDSPKAPKFLSEEAHEGYTIKVTEMKVDNQYQLAGQIEKEIDGNLRVETLIRADRLPNAEAAIEATVNKAKQLIASQGERLFKDKETAQEHR